MPYNDVINYSIGIMEFLYKNGFTNQDSMYHYPDPGIPCNDTKMKYLPLHLLYLSDLSTAEKKKTILENHTHRERVIFAANEPNWQVNDTYAVLNAIEPSLYEFHKKPMDTDACKLSLNALVSDFENRDLIDAVAKEYDNFNIVFFFFQGYLAYQWYRQYMHYKPFDTFSYKFNSMSRIIDKKRAYRLYITSKLAEYDLLDQGQVSCSFKCPYTENTVQEILSDRYCFLTFPQRVHVKENISDMLPLRFDKTEFDVIPNTSYEIDWNTMGQSFLHVVNETTYYENFVHLTEKTFKPIVCQRPFILASAPGSLAFLKRYGFRTFDQWIDESYDSELDHNVRLHMIAQEIRTLCSYSIPQLHRIYEDMKPVLEHNRKIFFEKLEGIILGELLENCRDVYEKSEKIFGPTNHSSGYYPDHQD